MSRTKEFSAKERFTFAAADLWGGGGQTVISVLYLVYLTNVLGVHPGLAGTTLMFAKIWDAVIDPVLGVVGDNTRTRWGRRRPYLLFGAAILLVAMALLWLPVRFDAPAAQSLYILLTNIFYATIASALAIAYSAMSTEISTDFDELNKVNVTRLIFSMLATAVCTILPTIFFRQLQEGAITVNRFYLIVVFGFGLVFTVPIFIAGLVCRERASYADKKTHVTPGALLEPLKTKIFRQMVALYLTQSVTLDTVSAIIIYYSLYVVKGLNTTIFLGLFLAIQLVMLPIFYRLVRTISKTEIFRFGLPLAVLGAMGIGFYPAGGPVIGVYLLTAATAFGYAGAMTLSWIIFPDVVDIGELVEGKRSTGSYSATMTFIRQISSALTIFLIGNLLGITGFINPTETVPAPAQPAGTVWAIRLILVFAFAIFGTIGWLVAKQMGLRPELSKRVKYFLGKRLEDGVTPEPLTAEEELEVVALIEKYK